jgi:hypothetical protein
VSGKCGKFLGFEDMVGDAASGNGGEFEEFEPVVRAGLEPELS